MRNNGLKVHLLVIDPQEDFMDNGWAALGVPGAVDDMKRLAAFISGNYQRLDDIHVTLDSHQMVDIAHPAWWMDSKGNPPSPYTLITADEIERRVWTTRNPKVYQRSLDYARTLEKTGKFTLFIWPPHCLIGTKGHAVQEDLMKALLGWQEKRHRMVDFVTKGTNPYTEHYGALMAEVPDPKDPASGLNASLLKTLKEADIILVAGEASSHCVKETINQIADNIGAAHIKKIQILTDCCSPVAKVGNGPDFPAIAQQWFKEISKRGVTLTTTKTFFK